MRRIMGALLVMVFAGVVGLPVHARQGMDKNVADIGNSIVRLRFFLKKDTERGEGEIYNHPLGYFISSLVDEKQTLDVAGVAVNDQGEILGPDYLFADKFIDRIEYETVEGATGTVRFDGILRKSALALYRPEAPVGSLHPVEVSKAGKISLSSELYGVLPVNTNERWELTVGPLPLYVGLGSGTGVFQAANDVWELSEISNPRLVLSNKNKVIGFTGVPARLDPNEEITVWKSENVLSVPNVIRGNELAERKQKVSDWINRFVYDVVVTYRLEAEGSTYDDFTSYNSSYSPVGRETRTYGLAVGPNLLFVPEDLLRQEAEKIESIKITVDGRERSGAFVGAFKDFTAFILRLEEGEFPQYTEIPKVDEFQDVIPFFVVNLSRRLGGRDVGTFINRGSGREKTYRNRLRFNTVYPLPLGGYLLDMDCRLIGFSLAERREGEEENGSRYYRSRSISGMSYSMLNYMDMGSVAFWASEIRSYVENRDSRFDPYIIVKTKEEAKRRPWLGVEYTPMRRDLAEIFKCEEATQDGERGLLVSHVYPGSPAERLGIKKEMILLSIQDSEEEYPIDLDASGEYRWEYNASGDESIHSEAPLDYSWRPCPWRNRANYLTETLRGIGEGKKVELLYWNGTEKVKTTFVIEQAPRDFESAEKYKDENAGLTMKDITYEVRHALKLDDTSPGVVVSKVEPGGPAAVAKIEIYEVIQAIDDSPIMSVRDFEERVRAAGKEGKEVLRLSVFDMGELRFANLAISGGNVFKILSDMIIPDENED